MTDTQSSPTIWVVLRAAGGPLTQFVSLRGGEPTDWLCGVTWAVNTSGALPSAVELKAPIGEALGPQRWRWVRLAEVIAYTRELATSGGQLSLLETDDFASAIAAMKTEARHKRGALPAAHFELIAALYNQAVQSRDPYPVKTVWAETKRLLGDRVATNAAVRGWVREAKKRGLITQTARPSRSPKRRGGPT